MVQIHPGPPRSERLSGAVAQLGERGLCKPEVVGSIPISSTRVSRAAMPARQIVSPLLESGRPETGRSRILSGGL